MAKPGDIVEFRSGLFGIEAPKNLAVLLERQRRKGVVRARVVTIEGEKEVNWDRLTHRVFKQRYEGSLTKLDDVKARLQFLIGQHSEGGLAEEAEDDLGALEEALWEATCDGPPGGQPGDPWTDEQIAVARYVEPSKQQLKDVREALARCRRAGTGRFETVAGRGDTWRPWTRSEVQEMREAWEHLQVLRKKLVDVQEDEEGERLFVRIDMDAAGLDDTDKATMQWAKAAMEQYVEYDGVPDGTAPVAGIGGLGATRVFGMDLHRALGFLAQDWIRGEHTTTSSDYVQFLLESGLWNADQAVASLTRRHVNQEPFFEHVEDPDAEAAANALPEPRLEDDPGREDLRHLDCYTIDPPDAKDFDDAVGIEDLSDRPDRGPGWQRLWVHIADVSHYVRQDSLLDRHAKKRATSVYLPGRVLPMLPHRIADHLCSLRDDGDRFAMSAAMDVDPEGLVKYTSFHVSLIRVNENLSYDEALRRADAGEQVFRDLLELADRMRSHRRGLALETGELKVLLEESGFSALEKHANPATRMIEVFMVAANEAVARHLNENGLGLLYRCHPLPDPAKAERFQHQMATMGFEVDMSLPKKAAATGAAVAGQAADSLLEQLKSGGGKLNLFGGGMGLSGPAPEPEEQPEPADELPEDEGFAALPEEEREAWLRPFRTAVDLLSSHTDQALAEVATFKLLGAMGRAYYAPENQGHFGLASTHYAHFTSPIRRYPDLVVHRNLKWFIQGGDPETGTPPHDIESLRTLCDHCSDQEQAADRLERTVKASALVLASLQGDGALETTRARITGITPASLFVQVGRGIDARIAARDLPGGPYQVDEWESMLYLSDVEAPQRFDPEDLKLLDQWFDDELGEARMVRGRLGDPVQVQLAGRDVAAGRTGARLMAWRGQRLAEGARPEEA